MTNLKLIDVTSKNYLTNQPTVTFNVKFRDMVSCSLNRTKCMRDYFPGFGIESIIPSDQRDQD